MKIRSLGYLTDLISPRFGGIIGERGDYVIIRTPSNPAYHWGNFILFSRPPAPGDRARWFSIFKGEIGVRQPTAHVAFGWDGDGPGEFEPFLERGLELNISTVLTAATVAPPPPTEPRGSGAPPVF